VLTFALKEAKLRTQTGLPGNFHMTLKESFPKNNWASVLALWV
jgi:hypothetical protein